MTIKEAKVDHPQHYGGKDDPYEAIKVIEAWGLGFCLGSVLKYIRRAGRKPGETLLVDLRKARWYLDREISTLEKRKALAREDPLKPNGPSARSSSTEAIEQLAPTLPRHVFCPVCRTSTMMTRDVARWRCDHCKVSISPGDPGFDVITAELNPVSQQPKGIHEKY